MSGRYTFEEVYDKIRSINDAIDRKDNELALTNIDAILSYQGVICSLQPTKNKINRTDNDIQWWLVHLKSDTSDPTRVTHDFTKFYYTVEEALLPSKFDIESYMRYHIVRYCLELRNKLTCVSS